MVFGDRAVVVVVEDVDDEENNPSGVAELGARSGAFLDCGLDDIGVDSEIQTVQMGCNASLFRAAAAQQQESSNQEY